MNEVRASWSAGEPTIGGWERLINPLEAERIGGLGYDWVLLDMEHSGLHWEPMIGLMQALELGGSRAMVRVASPDRAEVERALAYGAIGVVVPMVNTPETAAAVGSWTRYPPTGTRGNGQIRRSFATHAEADEDVVCVVMIETGEGLGNVEAIAAVPGIDALMIGQVDLALSLGWPLDSPKGLDIATHPQARDALRRVAGAARRHGKHVAAASIGGSDDDMRVLFDLGVDWLGYKPVTGNDAETLQPLIRAWKHDFRATGDR